MIALACVFYDTVRIGETYSITKKTNTAVYRDVRNAEKGESSNLGEKEITFAIQCNDYRARSLWRTRIAIVLSQLWLGVSSFPFFLREDHPLRSSARFDRKSNFDADIQEYRRSYSRKGNRNDDDEKRIIREYDSFFL